MRARYLSTVLALALSLQGCMNHQQHTAVNASQKEALDTLEQIKNEYLREQPSVVHMEYPPADLTPISMAGDPEWFGVIKNPLISEMEFGLAVRTIFDNVPVSLGFDHDVDQNIKISVFHNGTARSWLDRLALASGYAYKIEGDHVSWHRMMTATFDVMAMPGSQNHLVGSSDTEEESTDTDDQAENTVRVSTSEYSNNKASLSIWSDLTEVVASLLSEKGKSFVSEANTSITVKDYPENVRSIEAVINEFNERLSAQVVLDAQIVAVRLNGNRADGIDWSLVKTNTDSVLNFSSQVGEFISTATGAPTTFSAQIPASSGSSWTGSDVFVRALQQQGDVTVLTSPRTVTLNNQVAEMRINLDTAYLARSKSILNDSTSETTLEPGVVTDGFTMYVLPKIDIKDREIYLQYSTTLADLQDIRTVESGGSSIQTPQIQNTKVNSRIKLNSGETLLISGYQQHIATSNSSDHFGIDLLGQKSSESQKYEVMVLLTPVIMDN